MPFIVFRKRDRVITPVIRLLQERIDMPVSEDPYESKNVRYEISDEDYFGIARGVLIEEIRKRYKGFVFVDSDTDFKDLLPVGYEIKLVVSPFQYITESGGYLHDYSELFYFEKV